MFFLSITMFISIYRAERSRSGQKHSPSIELFGLLIFVVKWFVLTKPLERV